MNAKTKSSRHLLSFRSLSPNHGCIHLQGLGHALIKVGDNGFPCQLSLLDHPIQDLPVPDPTTSRWLEHLHTWWVNPSIPMLPCPLPEGTEWQQIVWRALTTIPSGATRSYADIALILGRPTAQRAVAQACASNPLPLFIPCHRVIARNGTMAGYRFGLERKRLLLQREQLTSRQ